jgi:hypothetical protein
VISRLNHIQILALTTTEKSKSTIKPSVLLQESDSLIQAVLYNEDLDIDLSHHVNLRSIILDKCKHISFSPISSDHLRTCEIHGLVFSHGHFQKLTLLLAQTKTLALKTSNATWMDAKLTILTYQIIHSCTRFCWKIAISHFLLFLLLED